MLYYAKYHKTHMLISNCFFCISNAKKPAVFLGVSQIDPKKCGRTSEAISLLLRVPMRSRSISLTPGMWRMVELAPEAYEHVLLRARWDRVSGGALGGGH